MHLFWNETRTLLKLGLFSNTSSDSISATNTAPTTRNINDVYAVDITNVCAVFRQMSLGNEQNLKYHKLKNTNYRLSVCEFGKMKTWNYETMEMGIIRTVA